MRVLAITAMSTGTTVAAATLYLWFAAWMSPATIAVLCHRDSFLGVEEPWAVAVGAALEHFWMWGVVYGVGMSYASASHSLEPEPLDTVWDSVWRSVLWILPITVAGWMMYWGLAAAGRIKPELADLLVAGDGGAAIHLANRQAYRLLAFAAVGWCGSDIVVLWLARRRQRLLLESCEISTSKYVGLIRRFYE